MITIVQPPNPLLFPIIIFLILLELGVVIGKKHWCKQLALQVKKLIVRKYDVIIHIKSLGIPTDFVKKSKLERELIQIDKDLAPRKEKLVKDAAAYDNISSKVKYVIYALLILYFWRIPLLQLTPSATWPMSAFLAFPRLGPGAIGVSATIAMVKAGTKPLATFLSSV